MRNKIILTILILSIIVLTFSSCGGITTPGTPSDSLNAMITTTTTSGQAPLEVTFDASESTAAQGNEVVNYEWDFGDEKTGEGQIVQHGFDSPGNYTVILTIGDNKGAVDTSSVIIKVIQPTETVKEQTFNALDGTEFDTGTGLLVSILPESIGGQKKLVVTENLNPQQSEESDIKLQSVYNISLLEENVSEGQKIKKESFEKSINAELTFDVPAGLDPNFIIILEWTDDGWVLASSSDDPGSIDSLGGVIASGGKTISIELQHFSTYALSFVELNLGEPIIDIHKSEPLITSDGDMCIDLTLESPNWGIFNIGAWYQIDVPEGLWYKLINSPTDLSFGDWGKNKGFLGPHENKKLQFTFWGNGGTAPIYLSVRDGWPMALCDYFVRVVGQNLEWPYLSREAMENDFIKKCGLGIATTVASELINKLVDDLINVTSIQDGVRTLWKWMKKYGVGNWATFIGTSKLAVDTMGHVLLNQGGYINYLLVGGILNPQVKVKPTEVVISPGESVQFSSNLTTYDGNQILSINPYLKWKWSVSGGGLIDENGLFTADNNTTGTFTIYASNDYFKIDGNKHKVEGEVNVTINVTGLTITTPLSPTHLSPGSSSAPGQTIDTLTPTLTWVEVDNADYYALAISEYPYGTSNIIYNPQEIYGSSTTIPGGVLELGKKYRWNMKAYNSAGWSDVSDLLYFQMESNTISATINSYSPSSKITVNPGQSFSISTSFTNTGNTAAYFYPGVSIWNSSGSLVFTDWGEKTYLNKDQQKSASWSPTINTPGEYYLQFGIWNEAKSELLNKKPSPYQNLIKVNTPPSSLNFTDLTPSQISTSTAPYQATLFVTGSNFNNLNRISFSWSGAESGTTTWYKGDTNWNNKVTINSDNSITLKPVVIESNPTWSGTAYWTVTLRDSTGVTASKLFTVTYGPDVISATINSYFPSSKITVNPGQSFSISTNFTNNGNTADYFYPGVSIWNSSGSLVFTEWGEKTYLNKDQQKSESWSPTINTPGEYYLQFGIWNEAKSELFDKEPSPYQNLIKVNTPPPSLGFTGLTPSQISTSTAPYQAILSATGNNFNNVNRVSFSWSGAESGTATWYKGDTNWNNKVTINSDNSMTLKPGVVETNPTWSGTAYWTVTLRDSTGVTASKSFTVTYTPFSTISATIDSYSPSSKITVDTGQAFTISTNFTNNGNTSAYFYPGVSIWNSSGSLVFDEWGSKKYLSKNQQGSESWSPTINTPGEYYLQFGIWNEAKSELLDKEPSPSQNLIKVESVAQLAPQVTGVDPSQPTANPSRQYIDILGNNFSNNAQVTLQIISSVYPIPEDRTQFIDSTRIKVYVGLTDSGNWKVWITNPDGQKSNEYSFYVKP